MVRLGLSRRAASRLFTVALTGLTITAATVAKAAPAPETGSAAQRVWGKLLTNCGGSYFYAGSVFDHGGMLSTVGAGNNPTLIEFKGVRFNSVPVRVTDADRENGVSAHARITMMAHLYRLKGESWEDGPDLQMRNTNDIIGRALQDVVGDAGELGTGGSMAFDLVRFKGTWAIARSSTTMSGPLTFSTKYYDVDKVIAAKVQRYSCAANAIVQPTLTPEEKEQAAAQAAIKAGISPEDAKRHAKQAADFEAQRVTIRDAKKGIPFAAITDAEFAELASEYDERGYEIMTSGNGFDPTLMNKHWNSWLALTARYPRNPSSDEWLSPGTQIENVCKVPVPGPGNNCESVYERNTSGPKSFVVIKVLSGPHLGTYGLIDEENYGSNVHTVCDPKFPGLKC